MKTTRKALAAILTVLFLVSMLPVSVLAAQETGSIGGDSTVNDVIISVVVPTSLDFALDPLELNVISGSQITTTNYCFVNKTSAPVMVGLDLTAVLGDDVSLVGDASTLSQDDPDVTTKNLYFAALGAKEITANNPTYDYAVSASTTATIVYDASTATLTPFDYHTNASTIVFALDKAIDSLDATDPEDIVAGTDGVADTLAANDKGVASFQFFGKLNTYAAWAADDVTVTGAYTLTALRATTYANYTTDNDFLTDGLNQLDTSIDVTAISVTGEGSATSVVNGSTLQMSAAITPDDATNSAVTWSVTAGTGSATISEGGLLSATGVGTVTVKATAQDGSDVFGTLEITVTSATVDVTGITVSGAGDATSVSIINTLQMSAVVAPDDATDDSVTWSVTPGTGAATISADGLLTPTSAGTVTVTATANDGSDVTGTLEITVSTATAGFIVDGATVTTLADTVIDSKALSTELAIPFYANGLTKTSLVMNGNFPIDAAQFRIDATTNTLYLRREASDTFKLASNGVKTMVLTLSDNSTYNFTVTVTD